MKQIIDGMLYDTEKSEEIYFDEENQRMVIVDKKDKKIKEEAE